MRFLSRAPLVAALALGTVATAVGCSQVAELKGQKSYKDANQAYQQQDYKKAAVLYEDAIQNNPGLGPAYFFLANSYDNLWKPSKKGDATNDALLQKAVQNYQACAEKCPASDSPDVKKLGALALQYLVQAYNADRLNDPAKAELVVLQMIKLDPTDPGNYFALGKIYEDAGAYEQAEQVYMRARDAKPNEPSVYTQLAGYYTRQGEFDKSIKALEERAQKEPNNPDAYYTIATQYWDQAYRGVGVKDADKKAYVLKGIENTDRALKIKPDHVDALVYKGLLLRLQANQEKDPSKQQDLIKQAETLHDKAEALRKQKAAGA